MMRTAGDIPVFLAEPHRRHSAVQLDQRMVADIGVVDMTPDDDRIIIGIYGHRRAAAFAYMIGNFDIAAEAYPTVLRHRIVNGRAAIFLPFFLRGAQIAFVEPGDVNMTLVIHRHGIKTRSE